MNPKIKALAWEELRVGGSIAGVVLAVGLGVQLWARLSAEAQALFLPDEFGMAMIVLPPALLALLLILNLDNSGALTGGFSRRILRLPVPIAMAVGIPLITRSLLVVSVTAATLAAARMLFESPIGGTILFHLLLLYLVLQILDWLRAPVSGLTSLLIVSAAGLVPTIVFGKTASLEQLFAIARSWELSNSSLVLTAVACFLLAFAIALPVTHWTRVGRRIGMAENWQWPDAWTMLRFRNGRRPFSSPTHALVWFEMRRGGYIAPMTTVMALMGISVALWLGGLDGFSRWGWISGGYLTLFSAIAAQALILNTGGLGKRPSATDYRYLKPLTISELAAARLWTNALALAPSIVLIFLFQRLFWSPTGLWTFIGRALEFGLASYRELAWMFTGQTIFVALALWALSAISTSLIVRTIFLSLCAGIVVSQVESIFPLNAGSGLSTFAVWVVLVCVTFVAYARAWYDRLLSSRIVAAWGFAWLLTALLIYSQPRGLVSADSTAIASRAVVFVSCLGLASLLPLPYVAVLFDIRSIRHTGRPRQERSQHGRKRRSLSLSYRVAGTVAIAGLIGAGVWLGWPARPAFEAVWRENGWPVTLAEVDASYPAVPDAENAARRYEAASISRDSRMRQFERSIQRQVASFPGSLDAYDYFDKILYLHDTEFPRDAPIPADAWEATEWYWRDVASETARDMKQIEFDSALRSRYLTSLGLWDYVDLEQYDRLRALRNDARVDALHWAINRVPDQAAGSVLAIISLSNSLSAESRHYSQLVRFGKVEHAIGALHDVMNRCILSDGSLASIEHDFDRVFTPAAEALELDRSFFVECIVEVAYAQSFGAEPLSGCAPSQASLQSLAANPIGLRIGAMTLYSDVYSNRRLRWPAAKRWQSEFDQSVEVFTSIAPFASLLLSPIQRTYESEWNTRTRLDMARTAIAVERYRLAHGALPRDLNALVPEFLSAVPIEYYSGTGAPLRYLAKEDGAFTVYSVYRDMDDDLGEVKNDNSYNDGDISFAVAPLSFRLGPQIEELPAE